MLSVEEGVPVSRGCVVVMEQVRVRPLPVYTAVVQFAVTSTPGWGTGWEGGRDVSHAVNQHH